jgi:hypothetical protein
VQEAAAVQVVEGGAEVDGGADGVGDLEPAPGLALQHVEERRAVEVLQQQERQAVVVAGAEVAHDVGVSDGAEDARLAAQRADPAAAAVLRRDDLARERAPVPCAPHLVEVRAWPAARWPVMVRSPAMR